MGYKAVVFGKEVAIVNYANIVHKYGHNFGAMKEWGVVTGVVFGDQGTAVPWAR